ncbi:MAG: LPS-assembly protein LptD [Pseudomonadales bacterium]|nr:LPS-assembly protein LptD [Pseudomonadales bacterium]
MPNIFSRMSMHATLLSLGLISPIAGHTENPKHSEWNCVAGQDGDWVCIEREVAGKSYPRPVHRAVEATPQDDGPQVRLTSNLDWVDETVMTDEEREKIARGCCGAYIEPERDYPDADLDPDQAAMRVAAAATEVEQESIAHLSGNVQITQGYRQVRSNRATVDQQQRIVDLEGRVQFREPGTLVLGDTAHINMETNAVDVDNLQFVMHEAGVRGTATHMSRQDNGVFYIDNSTYTTCEPSSNAWQLVSANSKINTETGIATAKHVRLEVKDIPILYLPWIRFPIDDRRASGLLYPKLELSQDNGFDYAQPIYLNLAPNYDATITPRFVQERGTMLELEGRHLSRFTETVVSGGFLSSDDGGDDTDEPVDPLTGRKDFEGEDRWVAAVNHTGYFGQGWSSSIDYTRASDNEYFRDLGNATLEVNSQTHLLQSGNVGYHLDNWNFGLQAKEYQTIVENRAEPYKILPRFTADGFYQLGDFEFNLKNQITRFDHGDDNEPLSIPAPQLLQRDTENTYITGDRIRMDYSASWDKNWAWGYFRPTAKLKYLSYSLDNPLLGKTDDSPSVTVPVGMIDTGIFMERDTSLLKGFLQTFEPRLFYVHSDYQDQSDLPDFDTSNTTFSYNQLFRDDRFTGGDRIGDTDQISIGLTTRLLQKSTGLEWLRASFGQIFYLDDRFVTLNENLSEAIIKDPTLLPIADPNNLTDAERRNLNDLNELIRDESNYAAELALRLSDNLRASADLLYDDDDGTIDKGSVNLRYHNSNDLIVNLGYRFTRQPVRTLTALNIDTISADIEQADFSTFLPIFDNWNLVARWNYDFTNSRELETMAGVEYDSCCWRISLVARKWIDRDDDLIILPEEDLQEDEGIFLQVQFKGLGGTGSQVDSILTDGIYGYQRRDY